MLRRMKNPQVDSVLIIAHEVPKPSRFIRYAMYRSKTASSQVASASRPEAWPTRASRCAAHETN